ncbi:unnamed protein product [Callosobruchus maculatus]|uniref:Uncharacterized protein n=1 Tax=Callosobruchus maculatus TaxID=64391 RepID=A0A653DE25_CALMS|nr:unnamed protein product [Callosobruchus maculatus]
MKSGDGITFSNAIKVYQIRTQSRTHTTFERNKNYEEFRDVYNAVLRGKKNYVKDVKKIPPTRTNVTARPAIDIKTVRVEVPAFGTENAIVPLKEKLPTKPSSSLKPILKNKVSKDACVATQDIVKKLKAIEKVIEKKASANTIKRCPTVFLQQTHQELDVAEKQLEEIKNMMEKRQEEEEKLKQLQQQQEKAKKVKSVVSYRPKSKTRHNECVSKKYMTTISMMKQKLEQLEKKYFSKPRVVYKSVNDTFTQFSNVEVLYENSRYPEDTKMDDALKGIINELDDMVNADKDKEAKPRDLSFQKPQDVEPKRTEHKSRPVERNNSISRLIDVSEAHLKKYQAMRQEIIDVEAFCQKICNLSKDSEAQLEKQPQKKPDVDERPIHVIPRHERETKSVFDDTNLQHSVMKSSYLMKEFKIEPSVKMTSGTDPLSRSKRRFRDMSRREGSITALINSLNSALENSIYSNAEI